MTPDAVTTVGLVVSFAALVTLHVATLFGLATQRRFGAVLGGLVFPPSAPVLAWIAGMRVRTLAWIVAAILYALTFFLAR